MHLRVPGLLDHLVEHGGARGREPRADQRQPQTPTSRNSAAPVPSQERTRPRSSEAPAHSDRILVTSMIIRRTPARGDRRGHRGAVGVRRDREPRGRSIAHEPEDSTTTDGVSPPIARRNLKTLIKATRGRPMAGPTRIRARDPVGDARPNPSLLGLESPLRTTFTDESTPHSPSSGSRGLCDRPRLRHHHA